MRSFSWKKIGGTTLPGGRVSRQSQRVGGLMQPLKTLIRHFEKYLHTMMLNLQNMLELPSSFWISKQPGEILVFRTFIAKFWIFAYFMQNIAIFGSGMFLWCHNYVTLWPIVLILVCMSREGPYLPIDTKINFIGGSVWKI